MNLCTSVVVMIVVHSKKRARRIHPPATSSHQSTAYNPDVRVRVRGNDPSAITTQLVAYR